MNWFFNCSLTQTDSRRTYAPACDIIMCSPLVVSAHNFPIHKNMFYNIVMHQHFSKCIQKYLEKIVWYIWSVCQKGVLFHPLSKSRKPWKIDLVKKWNPTWRKEQKTSEKVWIIINKVLIFAVRFAKKIGKSYSFIPSFPFA